ncbi:class I SAM-dependent methyltransferase, partial [Flavobacterium sp.]|jgi:ubiquinone/menaquinone biosynthesis C-methylase UbiE|uniref:class I SAM-dependent methyltransferase n=1 Tax=Flavobacterium sp. TaxID=239 RepID=UPI0037C01511
MFLKPETTLISKGDFIDTYHKIKQKGFTKLFSWIGSSNKRVANKWDNHQSTSDFWIIPEIQKEWNFKISGNHETFYEEYVVEKYLKSSNNLRLLSIGCGEGLHERNFAKYDCFSEIIGVDLAEERIVQATEKAKNLNLKISYFPADFRKLDFEKNSFDVVLFSSSLHHFQPIDFLLANEVKPLLKPNGLLIVFEYCGPNRLQWKNHQLKAANELLNTLPSDYKIFYNTQTLKKKVYRPGLLRMFVVDPSEAPDSANLVTAIHKNFSVVEETKLGWNLLHLTLKGIAHHFLKPNDATKKLLTELIEIENQYMTKTGESDAVFGVYQKK